MRLTLRTLLAWMDDTLSAAEVREIGKQLGESPYARELAERINRVARQRRLTVPGDTPPDGVDPNIVSAYLDNELDAEDVAAFEKLCLTSDVHLAEVASVHQILSLIGQKAKVPPEARHRMYRLVKGREASHKRTAKTFAPSHDEIVTSTTSKRPSPPVAKWETRGSNALKKSFIDRFGLAGTVLGLMGLFIFAAIKSLEEQPAARIRTEEPVAQVGGPQAGQPVPVAPATDPDLAKRIAAEKEAEELKRATEEAKKAEALAEAAKAAPGTAKIEKLEGVALVGPAVDGPWKPLDPKDELKTGEFLLNLTPAWTSIKLGNAVVTIQGVGEVGLVAGSKDLPTKLRIDQGRLVVRGVTRETPFEIDFRGKTLKAAGSTSSSIGFDVRPATPTGTADVAPASLQIAIPDGEVSLQWGDAATKLSGASSVSILPNDQFAESTRGQAPPWVSETAASALDSQLAERFAKTIRPGRPILASLVEAGEDEDKEIRRISIGALAGLGNAEMLVPILNETTDGPTRKATVDALRYLLSRESATRKVVRAELEKTFGPGAEVTEKLLVGFTPEESKEESTIVTLIQLLTAPDLGTRALAIDALRTITGRDSMEYDPSMPEGKGLANWRELVMKKDTRKNAGGERVPPAPQPATKPR